MKAAKLRSRKARNKVGRPRKAGIGRYPGGQIRHEERESEVISTVVDARRRIHGIEKEEILKSPYSGYVLGRLFLDRRISEWEREAGDTYAELMVRYYRLTGIPAPSARAQSLFSVKSHAGEVTENLAAKIRTASNKVMGIEGALLRLQDGPRVKTTIYNTIILDYDIMRTMSDLQLSWLKKGLQEIHFQLGLPKILAAG